MKRLVLAALAALALTAPPASASHTTGRCAGVLIGDPAVTGNNYTAVLYGSVTSGTTEPVWVRCFVLVNGSEAGSTPVGTGTGAAVTAGRADWTGSGELCVHYGSTHETGGYCRPFAPV